MLPEALPAPMMVCISSIKQIMFGLASSSLIRFFRRSSNCPRYFVPATIDAISSDIRRQLCSIGDTLLSAISCAKPSTMELLPTPGSPISMGLFFLRRNSISCRRCISLSRPTTGSILPSRASFVRSVENASITGVFGGVSVLRLFGVSVSVTVPEPFGCWPCFPSCGSRVSLYSSSSSERFILFRTSATLS